jgi:ankyrin repeat protein
MIIILAIFFHLISPVTVDNDIFIAIKSGQEQRALEILGEKPLLIHARDATGHPPLYWATARAQWKLVDKIIALKPDIAAVGWDGSTPLHMASHYDNEQVISALVEYGFDVNQQNRWGNTPLHAAARRNCLVAARTLIQNGVKLNLTSKEGWSALHVARMSGHEEMVDLLLEAGIAKSLTDTYGKTAADYALERPEPIASKNLELNEYEGTYKIDDGFVFTVWSENNTLYLADVATDSLYPVGNDEFFCSKEPWRVTFSRNSAGSVTKIKVDFLRRSVTGVILH